MALRYSELIQERDDNKRRLADYQRWFASEKRRTAALRGVITRLKRKADA